MAAPAKQLSDGGSGGTGLGQTTADLISLYGITPVSQRGNAVQALSLMSAGSYVSVTSNLAAILAEISTTLTALGVWKGAA
jgi:hypothetical protein